MNSNQHAPESIRLFHAMSHAGLEGAALAIEQTRNFKRSFEATVSNELGFRGTAPEILAGEEVGPRLAAYLSSFESDGYPPEPETRRFLGEELAGRAGSRFALGPEVMATCVPDPPYWRTIGGYAVLRDGAPMNAESAVAEYESRHGKIADPAVRAELAAIRVYVQIEWEIAL